MISEETKVAINVGLIAVLSSFSYCQIASAPFLHDDIQAVLHNPDVQVRKYCLG